MKIERARDREGRERERKRMKPIEAFIFGLYERIESYESQRIRFPIKHYRIPKIKLIYVSMFVISNKQQQIVNNISKYIK